MKPIRPRFQQQQQQTAETQHSVQNQTDRQFASVEEMLRYDAAQTTPPPTIKQRLNESIQKEPKSGRSWWKRLFSSS